MTEDSLHKHLVKRNNALISERESWINHWREINQNLLTRTGRFLLSDTNRGDIRYNKIYDSTGTRALKVLGAGMMSSLTSPARPWFKLKVPDESLMQYQPVKIWLYQITELMLAIFQRSNTYRALHTMYEELAAYGTAASIVVPDFDSVIHHHTLTAGEFCIATNWRGDVDTVYRELRKTVKQVVDEFGIDNVSITVKSLYNDKNYDAWVDIVHAIEPRDDRKRGKIDNLNMPWRSVYFEKGGDSDKVLRESGFRRFPALCPRWAISGGNIYGESPGMESLGDIKQLQHQQLRKAQGIDRQINPPLQAPTSVKNNEVDTLPGGVTYVDQTGAGRAIQPIYDINLNLNYLTQDIQDVRQRINSSFYADLFLMLSNMTDTRMTATEVAERHEEKLLMLGPVTERLNTELLSLLIDLTFDRIIETGIAPPPPDELAGLDIQVEYISTLAQAQRAVGVNSIDRFVGSIGAWAQIAPGVLDRLNSDQLVDSYGDALGVDPRLIVPLKDAEEIRQARAEEQAAQEQAMKMAQGADTAQKLSQVKTGADENALADMARVLTGADE